MANDTSVFGDLYSYSSTKGIVGVIPQTSDIKEKIVLKFKDIFQTNNISTDPETPIGRFIEALSLMFVDVCGVNAQTANFLNPSQAVGQALDMLGEIFGIEREGMNDADFRKAITSSQSRGMGFPESVRRAIAAVANVRSVVVLNNGAEDPASLPNADTGIVVNPHSMFICVGGTYDADEVAAAINETISAGCAMIQTGFDADHTVTKTITDEASGSAVTITFYKPTQIFARFTASIRTDNYTGNNAVLDSQNAVKSYIDEHNGSHQLTEADIISAISGAGLGIVCTGATMQYRNVQNAWVDTDLITIHPNEFIDTTDQTTTVTITVQ